MTLSRFCLLFLGYKKRVEILILLISPQNLYETFRSVLNVSAKNFKYFLQIYLVSNFLCR